MPFQIGGTQAIVRRVGLVAAMGSVDALDGDVGDPSGLDQVVFAGPLVFIGLAGIKGEARVVGLGKDLDLLVITV